MASDYLDRSKAANKAMGTKAKAVRSEQRRVANIVANKVGNAIGFAVAGPKEAQKYQQVGVLGSKGFVQAAAKVAGAAKRRVGIQEIKQTMAARRGYSSSLDEKGRGVFVGPKSPLWKFESRIGDPDLYAEDLGNMAQHAARNAARDLNLTIGTRKTYTALKADAANTGRQLAKDVSKVNYAIDKYGGEVARTQLVKWSQRKESAQALAQEAKKYASIASKGTKRQAK
jgi:hypothetical protein